MSERERIGQNDIVKPSEDESSAAGNEGESLEHIRQTANEFLDAGDDAIRRALSRDSEEFLRANRQQGGQ
jgi:hypothetical protein